MSEGRRLTRRDVLSGAAVAGAGALLGPGVARAAAARRGGGRVFGVGLGTLASGTSAPVAIGRAFCLVAVRWSSPAAAHIELRTRRAGGVWGPWGVASSAGHDGDGVRPATEVGEGMWTGTAHELQLRSRRTVHGVGLVLVAGERDAGRGPATDLAPDALARAGPTLPAGPGQPPIIAREVWAGGDHPPVAGPYYGSIEMGIVHHTENANGYSPGAVPAMLRAIYEFHVHGRGWFDIGYNYVIDRFGRIWEARQGGIDLPVIGAQAGDWNQISFGVSMLGTFSEILPSAAALSSLGRLLAWKMALNGLPVTGDIEAVVTPDGVSYTQFRVGERVRFPRIAGHRDVDSTDCPGGALYSHLPAVRSRVVDLLGAPPTLSLAGILSAPDGAGSLLDVSGRLAQRDGQAIAGAPIALQAIIGRVGDTRTVASVTTDADGGFEATVAARAGLQVRALHAASPAVTSQLLFVSQSMGGADVLGGEARGRLRRGVGVELG